jgi:hypothetical protein
MAQSNFFIALHAAMAMPLCENGDPERIRTSDLMLRRHLLYPTELRGLIFTAIYSHL